MSGYSVHLLVGVVVIEGEMGQSTVSVFALCRKIFDPTRSTTVAASQRWKLLLQLLYLIQVRVGGRCLGGSLVREG